MSDSLGPPTKRARLEVDAPVFGVSATALDAPGSPVDDMDDDFYDTTPVKPSALPAVDGASSLFAAAPAPASLHLPGLGSVGEAPAPQPASQDSALALKDEASEEGELSDEAAFYHDGCAAGDAVSNQEPAPGDAPQHDAAAADTAAHDTDDGELDAALAAAIDLQNEADSDAEDMTLVQAHDATAYDSRADFLRAAEANRDNAEAEWQLDSDVSDSDLGSSSGSSSADGNSDDEGSDEGELLDPAEQVRLLMAEVDDETGTSDTAKIKTMNEVEEQFEKPDITVSKDSIITELGKVESVVENMVVVKARLSGNAEVLAAGSALCLETRTVIGKISEQIGRVDEPRYSVGFTDPTEIAALGIGIDTPIYFVHDHSTFVQTEPLRQQKHTDASNLHDEETNDVDFSDDEKEADYKREQKAKKRARTEDTVDRPSLPIPTGPRGHVDAPPKYQSMQYQGGGLKYSDDEDEDLGMYKPLARPDHFEQIVGHGAPLEDRSHVRRGGMMRGRGGWGDRGRGFRGRASFGGRGDFGGGRGDRGGHGGVGRGDFGGSRGDRDGAGQRGDSRGGNNRGDRGGGNGGDRGGRASKGQPDRGRHQDQFNDRSFDRQQDNRQRNGPHFDSRSATSASPARQQQDRGHSQLQQDRGHSQSHNDRGHSQAQQDRASSQSHQAPARGGKNKNRKQRQREKREREKEQQHQQQLQLQLQLQQPPQKQQKRHHNTPPPASSSNANAYANNNNAGWPTPYTAPSQQVAAYTPAPPPPPPPAVAAPYVNQGAYGQQAPISVPGQQQQQAANWAQWAQWFQVVGAMSQQAGPQPQVQAPAAAPPPQPQVQYPSPPYQQYAQNAAPPANPQQQANAQAGPSLQDILRALGGGGAR